MPQRVFQVFVHRHLLNQINGGPGGRFEHPAEITVLGIYQDKSAETHIIHSTSR
jgi:hypothetical protein